MRRHLNEECGIGNKHYFVTNSSFCKICGFHGGEYEECHFLVCDAVWLQLLVTS
jgi:hypothetical protein